MADHDRDAGSRGEEEAPRDPTPGEQPPEQRERLSYGDAGDVTYPQRTVPMSWREEPRSDSFRSFIRHKHAQIIGAGLIGLAVGAFLGGSAVAVISNMTHRDDPGRIMFREDPGWGPPQDYRGGMRCFYKDGTYCEPQMGPPTLPPVPPTNTIAPAPSETS
jgi:hypothetical protein